MITSIAQLNTVPLVFVLYYAGSSGEFFSDALTQCFDHIHCPGSQWENYNRVKFQDFFGRSFNESKDLVSDDIIIQRVNDYLRVNDIGNKTCVAMVHPSPKILRYINQYFAHVPTIEITSLSELSRRFRFLARSAKIEKTADYPKQTRELFETMSMNHGYQFQHHLTIEWSNLIIDSSEQCFENIQQFLNHTGQKDVFLKLIQDYRRRNQNLIDQCYENKHPENVW